MLPLLVAVIIKSDEDRGYYGELYDQCFKPLVVYANSILHNWDDSLDIVQSLFLNMTSYIGKLRNMEWPFAYLKTCLLHKIYDHLSSNSVKSPLSFDEFLEKYGDLADIGISVEESVIQSDIYQMLRTYILDLKPLQRNLIILHYYYGMQIKEVSILLNITPEYASVIHKRAREELKRRIPRREAM